MPGAGCMPCLTVCDAWLCASRRAQCIGPTPPTPSLPLKYQQQQQPRRRYHQVGPTHVLPGGSTKEDVTLDLIAHMASTSAYQVIGIGAVL